MFVKKAGPMSDYQIPGWALLRRGKVREVYALNNRVLLVASDRLSVAGCVLPDPIPGKGVVQTQLAAFWFRQLDFVANNFIAADFAEFPPELKPLAGQLSGRVMLCRMAQPLPVGCEVCGYLAGAAWNEYRERGTAGGQNLPDGLVEASKLPQPVFIPTVKGAAGFDEPVTWEQCRHLLGDELAHQMRDESLEVYDHGRARAEPTGVIMAATKFQFGLCNEELLLINDCLTPDSSHFWPADQWEPGRWPPSFDKQFVRNWLRQTGWNGLPPAPRLPDDIIAQTAAKYREAYERIVIGRHAA